MDKKMIKILGIVIAVFIVLIIIIFLVSSCSKKKLDYNKIQDSMISAAKSYYNNHKDDLPKEDGDSKNIKLEKLISDGFMEEPSKTYKDKTLVCSGSVTVTNNNSHYLYTPSLTCGKNYKSKLLKDKAKEDSLVEDQGVGLYEIGDDFIYRGEVKNNYVRFAGKDKLFRIIRFSEDDNTVRLFEDMQVGEELRVPWDDRFNPYRSDYTGINDYMVDSINSRVKDTLQNYYNSAVWPDDMKAYIVTQDLCVGKRSKEDITKDGSTECSVKLANQQFGLLNVYEYLQASLDKNCNSTTAIACQNYNWFATYAKKVWTVNGDPDNTSKVWYILQTVNQSNANSPKFCNVVFNISDKVTYISGDGTHDNPYVIR